ncbi:chitobiase/beta-hexosaminidase C-terminal domain-containing protein [Tunturibacter psychrotolerans]|uniref:Chitobiase/beta-hexosaminidase C-terminal domain-containing protein n=1 Tax=Tunturiibacter psychrotolerans TaxID=3069686 RepID=A0AAU7ZKT0_9BACT
MKLAFLAFVLGITSLVPVLDSSSAFGQQDEATRMTEESLHEMERNQRLTDEAQAQAMQNIRNLQDQDNSGPSIPSTGQPKFSVKSGGVKSGTTVSISCPTPNAVIYYTTTGWTPTTSSRHYTGPITLLASTQLQAFAAAPTMANSTYTNASYTVKGPPLTVFPLTIGTDDVLHAKTRLHLVTNSTLSSKKATVGEKIPIVLDQDVKVGDSVEIPKGTSVDATITAVTRSGLVGIPGSISFAVHSLAVNGTTVPLQGGERLDGVSHTTRAVLLWVTFVGSIPAVMMHGGEGEIKPGMRFTVAVATDTPLKPSVPTP